MVRTMEYMQRRGAAQPETLVGYLSRTFTYLSSEEWAAHIAKGYVSIDATVATDPTVPLKHRAVVAFDPPRELEPVVDAEYRVLHHDDAVVVVSKSGNIPVGEGGRYCRNTLSCYVSEQLLQSAPLHVVHRLDKETSGLVVLAKTSDGAAMLGAQFAAHSVAEAEAVVSAQPGTQVAPPPQGSHGASQAAWPPALKRYQVVVVGRLDAGCVAPNADVHVSTEEATGLTTIDVQGCIGQAYEDSLLSAGATAPKPSKEDPLARIRMKWFPSTASLGKRARTVLRPVRVMTVTTLTPSPGDAVAPPPPTQEFTLCDVDLYSGRSHQIRVHCAMLGFPVVGDKLYVAGGGTASVAEYLARSRDGDPMVYGDGLKASRQLLHCCELGFTHPGTKAWMTFREDAMAIFLAACPWLAPQPM